MSNNILFRITRKFFGKLLNVFNIFYFIPPYNYVQTVTEKNIFRYLNKKKEHIKNWVIVGGYLGHEIKTILKKYPNCKITVFECSNRYIDKLKKNFLYEKRVKIINNAVSNKIKKIKFYETNLNGSGSLLKVGNLSKKNYNTKQEESFFVNTTTLDSVLKNKIDVLQIDVQGTELDVLKGAVRILKNTKAIFTEMSIKQDLYIDSVTFDKLNFFLGKHNFKLVLLGTSFDLTGNALYINNKFLK
jgi:FkbM family methyltransferase